MAIFSTFLPLIGKALIGGAAASVGSKLVGGGGSSGGANTQAYGSNRGDSGVTVAAANQGLMSPTEVNSQDDQDPIAVAQAYPLKLVQEVQSWMPEEEEED